MPRKYDASYILVEHDGERWWPLYRDGKVQRFAYHHNALREALRINNHRNLASLQSSESRKGRVKVEPTHRWTAEIVAAEIGG